MPAPERRGTGQPVPHEALVIGLAVTGQAVTRQLLRRGHAVVVADDRPGPATYEAAATLGVEVVAAPTTDELDALVRATGVVLPSPGVPARHPVFWSRPNVMGRGRGS